MIINNYDTISVKLNRKRPFINTISKKLVLPYTGNKKYYNIAKRYDRLNKQYNYFIIITNEENINSCKLYKINNKIYLNIKSIWHLFNNEYNKNFNVSVSIVEKDDTTEVYKIDY